MDAVSRLGPVKLLSSHADADLGYIRFILALSSGAKQSFSYLRVVFFFNVSFCRLLENGVHCLERVCEI